MQHPKLREDLRISQIDKTRFELVHPQTGGRFSLDYKGYLLAECFEIGNSSPEEVKQKLQDENGLSLPLSQIHEFLQKASDLDMLETPWELEARGDSPEPFRQFSADATVAAVDELRRLQGKFTLLQRILTIDRKFWVSLLVAVGLFLLPWRPRIRGPLVIESYDQVQVRSKVTGVITKVFVREGDAVEEGTALLQLEGFSSDIERKKAEIAKVEAERDRLRTGPSEAEIAELTKKVEIVRDSFVQAEEKLKRSQDLYSKGLISARDLEESGILRRVKEKEKERSEAELALLRKGTRPELVRAKNAELKALEVDLRMLVQAQERSIIRSPTLGVVATADAYRLAGRRLLPGELALEIANSKKLTAKLLVDETDIARVHRGDEIEFKVYALPRRSFYTSLSRIAPLAEVVEEGDRPNSLRSFRVYADLKNADQALSPGMTGVGIMRDHWSTLGLVFFSRTLRYLRITYVI